MRIRVLFSKVVLMLAFASSAVNSGGVECIGDLHRRFWVEVPKDGHYSILAGFPLPESGLNSVGDRSIVQIERADSVGARLGLAVVGQVRLRQNGKIKEYRVTRLTRYATTGWSTEYLLASDYLKAGGYELAVELKDGRCVIPMMNAHIGVLESYRGK